MVFDGALSGNDSLKCFVDATKLTDILFQISIGTVTSINVENYGDIGASSSSSNNMEVDEARIINRALSQDEITVRYNQWSNQATYWTVTVQPIITSVIDLGFGKWQINGTGFKPEAADPTGNIAGIPFIIDEGATDTSFTVKEGPNIPAGIQAINVTNSDNETDYTSIVSNTDRLFIAGSSPTNFIGMPSPKLFTPSIQISDTNRGDPRGDTVDNKAGENLVDGTQAGNPVRPTRGGGSNLGMYSKPSWLCK